MNGSDPGADIRMAYEASVFGMARGACRAFRAVVAQHQEAAEGGDLNALRAISDAQRLASMAVAEVAPPPAPGESCSEKQLRTIRLIA